MTEYLIIMKSLFKTVAVITVFSVFTRALGFFFRIFLGRTLGPELLGVYQVAFSVFAVLLTIVSSGIPLVISKLTAKYKAEGDKEKEFKATTSGLIIGVVVSVILCGVVLAFNGLFNLIFTDERCILILITLLPSVFFSAIYCAFRGSLWGHGRYFSVCLAELFEQVIRIIICLVMVTGLFGAIDGAISAAASLSIACVLSAVMVAIMYFWYGGRLKKPKGHFKEVIKSGAPITGVRIASSLIQPVISIIVPMRLVSAGFTQAQAMSQFGVAMGMTLPLLFVPMAVVGSLSMALIPDLSAAMAQSNDRHIESRIKSSLIFTIFVTMLFVPLFMGVGELAGEFFYANTYSGTLLVSAAWIMIPMGLTNITSSILNALGMEIKSLRNYVAGAIFLLAASWFLPSVVGVSALIYGMGICSVITTILNVRMISKKIGSKMKISKQLIILTLISLPVAAITSFVSQIFVHVFPTLINLVVSCALGAGLYVLLSVVFGVINISVYYSAVKEKLARKKKKRV